MTSHPDCHTTIDSEPKMLSGVQTGKGIPHDKHNTRGIAHTHRNSKNNIFMQRQLVQTFTYVGVGARDLYIDIAQTAKIIFFQTQPQALPNCRTSSINEYTSTNIYF